MSIENSTTSNRVFISYRRDASGFMARAIFQDLRANGFDAFMDVESIDSGQFDTAILNQIAARPYFILILTPGTVERCQDAGDWVRCEIETALDLQRVIIPLTTPNFSFEIAKPFLTGKLAQLSRFNGVEVPHGYFDEAMARLRTRFLKPIAMMVHPTPQADVAVVSHKVAQVIAEPTVTAQQLSAQDYYERALAHPAGEVNDKFTDYNEAIRLNPDFVDAYLQRAFLFMKVRNYDRAIEDFSMVIELDPKNSKAFYERGIVQENLDAAIADFTQAIEVTSQPQLQANAYVRRGFALRTQGKVKEAVGDLQRALELDPNQPLAPIIMNYVQTYLDQT